MVEKSYKFNKLQEAWLKDLETTRAKQGPGYLHSTSGWCCLGRACYVAGLEGKETSYGLYEFGPEKFFSGLPYSLRVKLKLKTTYGDPKDIDMFKGLYILNDDGYSFKEIAKILRENPEDAEQTLEDIFAPVAGSLPALVDRHVVLTKQVANLSIA